MKWNGIVSQRGQIAMMTKFATANETHSTSTCLCRRKSITRMSHGFDRRIRAELLAQPADAHVDDVRSRIEVVAPHIGEQPFAAHNFAGMKDEMVEQPELARGQLRRPTVEPRLVTREIQYEATDALHVAAVAVRRPPSYLYTRAREELLEGKRLRQVVARSELEAAQLRPQVGARGEDQHRQLRPLLAERGENLEAVGFRQEQVEDDEVVVVVERALQPALAVLALVDGKALCSETPGEECSDARFLDQQDPQAAPGTPRYAPVG